MMGFSKNKNVDMIKKYSLNKDILFFDNQILVIDNSYANELEKPFYTILVC